MMPFKILGAFLSISFGFVNAELPSITDPSALDPELVGKYHTDAFLQLTNKYASELPKDMKSVELDMFKIISNYCENLECVRNAYQGALENVPLGARRVEEVVSESMNDSIKGYLKSFESAIYSVTLENTGEIISELESIQATLRGDETLDENDKYLGLAAGSIAIESTTLWVSVFNDPSHPLHAVRDVSSRTGSFFQHRKLQSIIISFPTPGASNGNQNGDLNFTIFADFITLIAFIGIPFPAIFASLWAFGISNEQGTLTSSPTKSLEPSISKVPTQRPSISSAPSTPNPSMGPSLNPSTAPSR